MNLSKEADVLWNQSRSDNGFGCSELGRRIILSRVVVVGMEGLIA